jgi:UDPglucose--hexose-1-phosphate uridylyltransferase
MRSQAHRRFDPLRGEWVLVSPHRNERPWQGQVERPAVGQVPQYDAGCYLCPGNRRANGETNPHYTSTFAFDNDFAALGTEHPALSTKHPAPHRPSDGLKPVAYGEKGPPDRFFISELERGVCRVLCFDPRHDLTLARMDAAAIRRVVDAWIGECAALARAPWARYALVFENRGDMMGASNPHPHCQIWATEHVPNEPQREQTSLEAYRQRHGSCLLCDYVSLEIASRERIVCLNDEFVALVPYWAVWPFETLVIARRHVAALGELDDVGRDGLSQVLKQLTTRYDNVFEAPFPYSMGFHQAFRHDPAGLAHLHAHFYPPLLRSATVRKFLVGFEMLGSPQRDLTPEDAAARLQAAADVHYSERSSAEARP